MTTKAQIISEIQGLQRTRQYADEIEWQVLTNHISRLFEQYNELEKQEAAAAIVRQRVADDPSLCWNSESST